MIQKFDNVKSVFGEVKLFGDKSISHRAVMFGSLADGISVISNCSSAEDVNSTINCFEKLGVKFRREDENIIIHGRGFRGFTKPTEELYAGNSGTTSRLISGILTAQNFTSIITGDDSLSSRPMMRIVEPLRTMGAEIHASDKGTLPLTISQSDNLHPVNYTMKVASAQVKSAMLLTGLHLEQETIINEPVPTRNHTEKMLRLKTEHSDSITKISVSKNNYPKSFQMVIPSDISSASFFIVMASLLKDSNLLIKNVSLNETRTGILDILLQMGGDLSIENEVEDNGEKRGDIRIKSGYLKNINIPKSIIPNIIDEIPILSVAGVFAEGNFFIDSAKELRVKESDRIKALCYNYKIMGLDVIEFEDGFEISGKISKEPFVFESFGDHRIAMAFAVMSMHLKNGSSVNGFECVNISNPNFLEQVSKITKP